MVWSKGRTSIRSRSSIPGIALFLMVTFGMLLSAAPAAFAVGGSCPTGADYINPAKPTDPLVTLSSLGITNCYLFLEIDGIRQ